MLATIRAILGVTSDVLVVIVFGSVVLGVGYVVLLVIRDEWRRRRRP
jgi:hypothetical protein